MVTEIRIYIEGGGNNNTSRRKLRAGFSAFLGELRERARENRLRWSVILCGPRSEAFASFRTALRAHPDAWNLLLVDSEAPVTKPAWAHLSKLDGWKAPEEVQESQCHLMVQAVEAWLVADPDALEAFYGHGFRRGALPGTQDVEAIDKKQLFLALARAIGDSRKGPYHKVDHCAALLETIDPALVRERARHCDRLFQTVEVALRG